MEPKDYFKKKIIGQLTTRIIDKLSIDGVPTSIDSETKYDIIDTLQQGEHKFYITNTWENEEENVVLAIHRNFVKETTLEEDRDRAHQSYNRLIGESNTVKGRSISKGSRLTD